MLRIWGRDNSVNVQKALWCCEEMEVPYERVDAGGSFGVVNTQQYRNLNPNGLVPTIEDDGFVLWESNAIVRYLAAKHSAGKLWPEDLKVRAEADRWMDWQNNTFWPAFRPLFWNLVRTPGDQRDAPAMEESRLKTVEILGYLDAHLRNRSYIAGEALTMGDIPLGCAIWRWVSLPVERPELANVQRWFELLGTRPAYRKVVMQPLS
ncbi:MAG TPA: glutathione S-transferase [Burkholderiales bacterium]